MQKIIPGRLYFHPQPIHVPMLFNQRKHPGQRLKGTFSTFIRNRSQTKNPRAAPIYGCCHRRLDGEMNKQEPKLWVPIPDWPFPIPWAEIVEWESRDTTGELGKQLQKDMLAYIDWAIGFIKHEGQTIEEGHRLYAEMTKWKPEMFPKKVRG